MSDLSDAASPYEGHPTPSQPRERPDHRGHVVPAKAQTFGMWLVLLGLGMLFASGMLAYIVIRLMRSDEAPLGDFRPLMADWKLITSTVLVIAASVTIHQAVRVVREEQQASLRRWLWVTNVLAVAFVAVQTPAMIQLLSHDPGVGPALQQPQGGRPTGLWALVFFFVLIHAAHVLGGIIYLSIVTAKAYRGFYDHEHFIGVRHAALYWHFLDFVWLGMFGTFLVLG